ncbi:MAG: MFS transporter [Gemmobacter sp.]|uniref:MFS transporter n=1 Tax=Gemmobacter sp. TaxID=1898957 RepID=UPI00391B6F8F
MPDRILPDWPRKAPAPGVRTFALLGGLEAGVRATLTSVMPLEMHAAFGNADTVSGIYFVIGFLSLAGGLMVPWLTTHLPRRWTYSLGIALYLTGHAAGVAGGPLMAVAVACTALGTVTCFVCLSAYVLDYVSKPDLGRNESLRMFYSGLAWTLGPVVGVTTLGIWRPLPFLIAGGLALALLVTFWVLRLGNGKVIARARAPAVNPLAYLGRFFAQPRLIAGWTFAVIRSAGWWVFVIYLPIYAVEAGLDKRVGGLALSASSAMLFATPLMLRWMQARSVRRAVQTGFAGAAICFVAGTAIALTGQSWGVVAVLLAGTTFLLLLDVAGGLPFLLAVKPSERTEMAAVYSSFRDVSGIFTPGLAWAVLLVAPLPWLFAAIGLCLGGCWALAARLHPRLGAARRR